MVTLVFAADDGWDYKLALSYGAQQQQGSWKLTSANTTLATETYNIDVKTMQTMGLNYRFLSDGQWLVKGFYNWLLPNAGSFQQDNLNNNATQPYQTLLAQTLQGDGHQFELAFGPQWRWQQRLGISPLLAYRRDQQHITLQQGSYTVCDTQAQPNACQHNTGAVDGLNSKIHSTAKGWLYGVDVRWLLQPDWTLAANWLQGPQRYYGHMEWNLNTDLQQPVSQSVQSTVSSRYLQLSVLYALSDASHTFISWHQTKHNSHTGVGYKYLSNGSIQETSVNSQRWQGQGWHIGIQYSY